MYFILIVIFNIFSGPIVQSTLWSFSSFSSSNLLSRVYKQLGFPVQAPGKHFYPNGFLIFFINKFTCLIKFLYFSGIIKAIRTFDGTTKGTFVGILILIIAVCYTVAAASDLLLLTKVHQFLLLFS